MSMVKELLMIMLVYFSGEWISQVTGILLPGNVIGMILLLFLLMVNIIKLEQIAKISALFLNNLTLFFIPAGVGIMVHYHLLEGIVVPFMTIIVVSTFLVMIITGYAVEIMQRMVNNGSDHK